MFQKPPSTVIAIPHFLRPLFQPRYDFVTNNRKLCRQLGALRNSNAQPQSVRAYRGERVEALVPDWNGGHWLLLQGLRVRPAPKRRARCPQKKIARFRQSTCGLCGKSFVLS